MLDEEEGGKHVLGRGGHVVGERGEGVEEEEEEEGHLSRSWSRMRGRSSLLCAEKGQQFWVFDPPGGAK
jgi:hypothetical protein